MKLKILGILTITMVGLSACGEERSNAAGGAISLMGSMFSNSIGALGGEGNILAQQLAARDNVKKRLDQRVQLIMEEQMNTSFDVCSGMESNLETAFNGASCTVTNCDGSSDFVLAFSCTGISDTVTCGATSFELSDFSYESSLTVNLIDNTGTMTADMSGNVSGGLSGNVSCSMGITISESGGGDLGCEDLDNFSCSVAGQTLTCEEMQASASAFSCGS